jgi:hypothetical protein
MKHKINRRDFLNGTQVAIGASLLTPWTAVSGTYTSKFALAPNYYQPAKTGLRGSHSDASASQTPMPPQRQTPILRALKVIAP